MSGIQQILTKYYVQIDRGIDLNRNNSIEPKEVVDVNGDGYFAADECSSFLERNYPYLNQCALYDLLNEANAGLELVERMKNFGDNFNPYDMTMSNYFVAQNPIVNIRYQIECDNPQNQVRGALNFGKIVQSLEKYLINLKAMLVQSFAGGPQIDQECRVKEHSLGLERGTIEEKYAAIDELLELRSAAQVDKRPIDEALNDFLQNLIDTLEEEAKVLAEKAVVAKVADDRAGLQQVLTQTDELISGYLMPAGELREINEEQYLRLVYIWSKLHCLEAEICRNMGNFAESKISLENALSKMRILMDNGNAENKNRARLLLITYILSSFSEPEYLEIILECIRDSSELSLLKSCREYLAEIAADDSFFEPEARYAASKQLAQIYLNKAVLCSETRKYRDAEVFAKYTLESLETLPQSVDLEVLSMRSKAQESIDEIYWKRTAWLRKQRFVIQTGFSLGAGRLHERVDAATETAPSLGVNGVIMPKFIGNTNALGYSPAVELVGILDGEYEYYWKPDEEGSAKETRRLRIGPGFHFGGVGPMAPGIGLKYNWIKKDEAWPNQHFYSGQDHQLNVAFDVGANFPNEAFANISLGYTADWISWDAETLGTDLIEFKSRDDTARLGLDFGYADFSQGRGVPHFNLGGHYQFGTYHTPAFLIAGDEVLYDEIDSNPKHGWGVNLKFAWPKAGNFYFALGYQNEKKGTLEPTYSFCADIGGDGAAGKIDLGFEAEKVDPYYGTRHVGFSFLYGSPLKVPGLNTFFVNIKIDSYAAEVFDEEFDCARFSFIFGFDFARMYQWARLDSDK
ncbi:MAG: hypothetical protein KKB81_08110 [Candidatus Margulisbacteria bacterium]|nr:hypothetical protein [Candidatus Margulisiibacteriota bacterium]MBU1021741.1 hypothetical protein [Candidatus Margulisiibacteriota bacterium]MBU1729487.1 hypothetical protein [Candidatus Margulisiibacteriota bacterium]MBU1955412.1 hypothetical protein [Candidatus Margulisiibacteriota bacterium]